MSLKTLIISLIFFFIILSNYEWSHCVLDNERLDVLIKSNLSISFNGNGMLDKLVKILFISNFREQVIELFTYILSWVKIKVIIKKFKLQKWLCYNHDSNYHLKKRLYELCSQYFSPRFGHLAIFSFDFLQQCVFFLKTEMAILLTQADDFLNVVFTRFLIENIVHYWAYRGFGNRSFS